MGEKIGAADLQTPRPVQAAGETLFVHGSEERAVVRNRKEKVKRALIRGAFLCAVRSRCRILRAERGEGAVG